jgi:hypothetical protein
MADNIDYGAIAQRLLDHVTSMQAEVTVLTDRPQVNIQKLSSAASVPDEFIDYLTGVVTRSPRVSTAVDDVNGMQDSRRFAAVFSLLEARIRAFADGIHATSVTLRHESGARALNAYATVQGLLRQNGGMDLAQHVRNLRTILGRGRGRGTKEPKPAPAPDSNSKT